MEGSIKHKSKALKHSNTKNDPINRNRVGGINMVPCPKLGYLNQFDPCLHVNSHTAIQDEEPVCGKRWKVLFENILDFLLKSLGFYFLYCELLMQIHGNHSYPFSAQGR